MRTGNYDSQGDTRLKSVASENVNTVLYLPFDGVDGSTIAKDLSFNNRTVTFAGTAQLDTAQSKFGGSSLLLDGNSDYISVPDSDDFAFGTGDFTIQTWVRFNSDPLNASTMVFCGQYVDANNRWYWGWFDFNNAQNGLQLEAYSGGVQTVFVYTRVSSPIDYYFSMNTWYHVAVTRKGSTFKFYIDGSEMTGTLVSMTSSGSIPNLASPFYVGNQIGTADTYFFNGWIDDFSAVKGKALSITSAPTTTYHVSGNTLYVGSNCTYTTIGSAMTAASVGDTILVAPGTYSEAVTFSQDNISLIALGDYTDTIITQANARPVDMSTKSGCVIEGFTVTVTAATTNYLSCVKSSNDDTSAFNYIKNCNLSWTSATTIKVGYAVEADNGNIEVSDCILSASNTYVGSDDAGGNQLLTVYCNPISHTVNLYRNKITTTWVGTGDNQYTRAVYVGAASGLGTLNCYDNDITVTNSGVTASRATGIHCLNYFDLNAYRNRVFVSAAGNYSNAVVKEYLTGNLYNNTLSATTTAGSPSQLAAIRAEAAQYVNSYNDNIVAGNFATDGTPPAITLIGTAKAGDSGYGVVSPGTTGGTGTAGSGNQYFPLTVNGVTYKILHDGTV